MNTCECVNPPGGTATCGDDQLAICVVEDGVSHTYCITLPRDGLTAERAYQDANHFLARYSRRQRTGALLSLRRHVLVPASSTRSVANFVLAIIKVEPREPDQNVSRDDIGLLLAGEHRVGNRIIRFRIPPERGHTVDLLTRPRRGAPIVNRPIERVRS